MQILKKEYIQNKKNNYIIESKNEVLNDDEYYIKASIEKKKQDKLRSFVLKQMLNNDKLINYQMLIKELMSGKNYSELYEIFGLNWYEVNEAIEEIGFIYRCDGNDKIEKDNKKNINIEDINKFNSKFGHNIQYLNTIIEEFYNII